MNLVSFFDDLDTRKGTMLKSNLISFFNEIDTRKITLSVFLLTMKYLSKYGKNKPINNTTNK